jgi:hypothetical protein
MSGLALIVSLSNLGLRMISEKKLAQELQAITQRLANQELLLQSVVSNTMDSLGNQEVRNAQEALKDALMSSSPRHELTSAINHLQSAASHFEEKAARVHFGKEGYPPKYTVSAEALSKAANCYAVIATVYAGLKERDLTAKYANLFKADLHYSFFDKRDRNSGNFLTSWDDFLEIMGFLRALTKGLFEQLNTSGDVRAWYSILVFSGLSGDLDDPRAANFVNILAISSGGSNPITDDFIKLLDSKATTLYPE